MMEKNLNPWKLKRIALALPKPFIKTTIINILIVIIGKGSAIMVKSYQSREIEGKVERTKSLWIWRILVKNKILKL